MICRKCGETVQEGARVCDYCGEPLPLTDESSAGAEGMRQGRAPSRVPGAGGGARPTRALGDRPDDAPQDAGRPETRHGLSQRPTESTQPLRHRHGMRKASPQRFGFNWALFWFVIATLAVAVVIGAFVYLKTAQSGQVILARMGREANADAWWTVGQEYLDQGYIEKALNAYELAYSQEPEREDIYEKLLLLAEGYEAAGRLADAERVFTSLYAEHDEKNVVAYRHVIRLMLDQDRLLEATALMRTAYEKTGDETFRNQRQQMLPVAPTASLAAGSYLLPRTVELQSAQGYDIFYTLGEGELPEDGQLYTEGLLLNEGTHVIRAICVSSELYSDEMTARYIIKLPTPGAPKSRLAAGTYERAQKVYLYMLNDENNKKVEIGKDVTVYYTIDNTAPDTDSPLYTGEPILLPGGRVTLRAIAINSYGKVSNELNVIYDINIRYNKYYRPASDAFSGCKPMETTIDAFTDRFGVPTSEEPVEDDNVRGTCTRLVYPWGEARFVLTDKGRLFYMLDTTSDSMTGPRNTKLGMSQTEVTSKFRDMGQVANQKGNRSLYYDKDVGQGKYAKLEDGAATIAYACWESEDASTTTVTYYLQNDTVTRMTLEYTIKKR